MNLESFLITEATLARSQQAEAWFLQGDYTQVIERCEQAIKANPDQIWLYGYLGLALLLQNRETEAQVAWMTPILETESLDEQQWIEELIVIIQSEAIRQEAKEAYESAWLLRQHLRELIPEDLENQFCLLELSLQANLLNFEDEELAQAIAELSELDLEIEKDWGDRLLRISQELLTLDPGHPETLSFLRACIPHLRDEQLQEFMQLLLNTAGKCYERSMQRVAAQLASLCAQFAPDDTQILFKITNFLQHGGVKFLVESIAVAERCLALATDAIDRIRILHCLLSGWIYSGGDWQRANQIYNEYKSEVLKFLSDQGDTKTHTGPTIEQKFHQEALISLLPVGSVSFYFEDNPQEIRPLRNQIAAIAQAHLQTSMCENIQRYEQCVQQSVTRSASRLPKIGYLAANFRQHSIGWLCRWLMKYHNHDRFEIHLYSTRRSNDLIQQNLINKYGDRFHFVSSVIPEIADQIFADGIDILVELDSLTNFGGCGVVALKPAPIQVHWLGYDSSGIPGVDYFIVDPYVLPENAQNYYQETLWRLPHTFIAVDGFEVDTPTLRRDQLEIPNDAIVYLSSQTGMKRNADHARLQLKILKAVPNSYFLIKSFLSNPEFVEPYFKQLAEEEGVSSDRLRFLPVEPSELIHRANLRIADVILDTYPYSGATTTLEALWMGLPIVTRVGEQFAARNSYAMMRNAGLTEGIAYSDEEYLQWGIRLGTDTPLREDIFYRLHQFRHTSPLWNSQQFACEMENAYEQMWEQYTGR